MKFIPEAESWNVYRLEDGSEVKIRTLMVAVKRKEGEFGPDGTPAYDINFQQIVHIEAPEHLHMKQPQAPITRQ